MDDEFLEDSSEPKGAPFGARGEGRIDFFRAYSSRNPVDVEGFVAEVESDPLLRQIVSQINGLILEYRATAGRVGEVLGDGLVLELLESLRRNSQEDLHHLFEVSDVSAVERFLAESLFNEIQELQRESGRLLTGEEQSVTAPYYWRACLRYVSKTIEENILTKT